ncbi:MAG: tetratricopeptide repeat protein [Thermoanaerobaculia bacterium]|nr:tetratricopeptide repeat protein [Thermoanaerobaculia bacterium]
MTRDHLLVLLIGLLSGFILGYIAHEVMAARQPVPAFAGGGQAAQQAAPPRSAQPGTAAQQAPAGMEEVQRLRAHVAENPDDLEAVRMLADLNYDIANWGRAVELYRSYLDQRPEDVDVATDLGAALRHLGQPEEALALFDQVRVQRPDHWQSLYNQILVLAFDLGRLDDAWERVQELQELQPGNPDVIRLATEVERRRATAS